MRSCLGGVVCVCVGGGGVDIVTQRYWLVGARHFNSSRTMLFRYFGQQ
jgi:hypothetical protein